MTIQDLINKLMEIPEDERNLKLVEYDNMFNVHNLNDICFEKTNVIHNFGGYACESKAYALCIFK